MKPYFTIFYIDHTGTYFHTGSAFFPIDSNEQPEVYRRKNTASAAVNVMKRNIENRNKFGTGWAPVRYEGEQKWENQVELTDPTCFYILPVNLTPVIPGQ